VLIQVFDRPRQGIPADFLMLFGQFPAHRHRPIGAEVGGEISEIASDPVGGAEHHDGSLFRGQDHQSFVSPRAFSR